MLSLSDLLIYWQTSQISHRLSEFMLALGNGERKHAVSSDGSKS